METEEDLLIEKYKTLVYNHEPVYFDISEFEIIISHYICIGEYYEALEALFYAKLCHPQNRELELFKVEIFIGLEELDRALEVAEELENQNIKTYKLNLLKGEAYVAYDDIDSAVTEFKLTLNKAFVEEEEDAYSNPDILEIPFILADAEYYKPALYFLHILMIHNSNNVEIISQIATCYKEIGKFDKAEKYYDKALDIDPFNHRTWISLGLVCIESKNYEKALSSFEFALAIKEKCCRAIRCKTETLIAMERYDDAIAWINDSVEDMDTANAASLFHSLAECYMKISEEEKAINCYYKAIEADPDSAMPYWGLARILYSCDDFQLAIRLIEKAIDKDPDNFNYIHLRGLCMTALGADSFNIQKFSDLLNSGKSLDDAHKIAMTLYYFGDLENCCKFLLNAANINASSLDEFFKHIPDAKNDAFIINYLGKYLK
ncbi:MAG: tetratricopeptide repeat protein [Prevotellaceae bacterium]|jgi:tetratricopeptide (TPR) repeat protein|nr:tetratricopeptide repeat protein [Prevotellaceae bacterium]